MNHLNSNLFMKKILKTTTIMGLVGFSMSSNAAVTLDRTRLIFDSSLQSVNITISNKNTKLPFLAQAWMENSKEEKITSPFIILPPIQRLEPGQSSQVRIEALAQASQLPQDKESVFYFNLREVPPKSEKPNVMQIALQSKIKVFYRPKNLMLSATELINNPWQEKLVLVKSNNQVIAKNPTPYYTTLLGVSQSKNGQLIEDRTFKATMIAPFSEEVLSVNANWLGASPVLTYINDYGGRPKLQYSCGPTECHVSKSSASLRE
jgi:chaperone protein PapD